MALNKIRGNGIKYAIENDNIRTPISTRVH